MIGRPPNSPLFPSTPLSRSKLAASSSARRLVSRPSNASAQEVIGEGNPPHTITQRSAIRIREDAVGPSASPVVVTPRRPRSEEHTSELQSLAYLVCRLLLEK